ncbi:MAG: hypothetical protein AAGH89_08855, partial [Verrucomicrobiota bacterium]
MATQTVPHQYNIDLMLCALLNALFHPTATDPGSPVEAQVWYNSTQKVLKYYDGSAIQTLGTASGVSNIVEDLTPQLGGMLDVNGQALGDGTLELLKFIETASAVNEITIANAATGSGPTLSASGDDTNIDLNLSGKGTGGVTAGGSPVVTTDATQTLTNKSIVATQIDSGTLPADRLGADSIDDIGEIHSNLKSGADGTLITGTAGADGNVGSFNTDGDLVDSAKSASDIHAQNSDTGTTEGSFVIDSGNTGPRIKNDSGEIQVRNNADNADANLKAADGAFTGDLVVTGNLTVNGTQTTVNTETVTVDDNIMVLNNNESGTPSENAGIEIERGTSANAQVLWNESTDRWQANDGASTKNLKRSHPATI